MQAQIFSNAIELNSTDHTKRISALKYDKNNSFKIGLIKKEETPVYENTRLNTFKGRMDLAYITVLFSSLPHVRRKILGRGKHMKYSCSIK